MAHIHNHQHTPAHDIELRVANLHEHFRWTHRKMSRVLRRLRALGHVRINSGSAELTDRGDRQAHDFRKTMHEAYNIPDLP